MRSANWRCSATASVGVTSQRCSGVICMTGSSLLLHRLPHGGADDVRRLVGLLCRDIEMGTGAADLGAGAADEHTMILQRRLNILRGAQFGFDLEPDQ